MSEKTRLGLIYGGKSSEHEVSLRTAFSIIKAVDRTKYEVVPVYIQLDGTWIQGKRIQEPPSSVQELRLTDDHEKQTLSLFQLGEDLDIIFPVVHGPYGEDGTLQGLLEMINIPYVGCGVLGSSVGMDKVLMKKVCDQVGLPQVKYVSVLRHEFKKGEKEIISRIEEEIGFPCFVKPANLGSSVGISKVKSKEQLPEALRLALRFDRKLIIEEGIEARELEISVLGNDEPMTSCAGEIIPINEFYDYESKYKNEGTKLRIPADIPESVVERMSQYAIGAFQAIDCFGLSRVDYFWEEKSDQVYINEINTMPGFTPISMYPRLWEESGIAYSELIDRLIELGFERFQDKTSNESDVESLE